MRFYVGVAFFAAIATASDSAWWWGFLIKPGLMMAGLLIALGREGPPVRAVRLGLRMRFLPLHPIAWFAAAVAVLALLSLGSTDELIQARTFGVAAVAGGLLLLGMPRYHLSLFRSGAARPDDERT